MSLRLGYDQSDAAPNFTHPAKNVDEPAKGLSKLIASAVAALETSVAPVRRSHTTHDDVMRSNTAWSLDPVAWAKRQAATKVLEGQTERIADALLRAGVNVVLDGDLTMIGAVTGVVEHQRVYRAVRFLPTVAGRDRRGIVNGLKLFISGHPNSRYFRYAVMTCAQPVPVGGDLRTVIRGLSRRISKWSHEARKKYGIEALYRGIEFTRATAAERDAAAHARGETSDLSEEYGADTVLYHVHANVLYWPTRNIAKLWPEFLRFTHHATDAWWKDNGRVEKVEEIVKYCSKPADTLAASDDELVWLYQATRRLKICQPLGVFKLWLAELEKAGEKVVRVRDGRGDGRLRRVLKRGRKPPEPVDEYLEAKKAEQEAGEAVTPAVTEIADSDKADVAPKTQRETPPSNVVLGLTLPQWRHTPWAEPLIMVQHYDPTKAFGEGSGDIEAWRQRAREDWDNNWGPSPAEALRVARMALDTVMSADDIREAAEAAPYIVHTCRPTVPEPRNENDTAQLENDDRELSEDVAEIVRMFPGARRVVYIGFESSERLARQARMRSSLAEKEAHWAQWRRNSGDRLGLRADTLQQNAA
ncbi:hypothetical protein [Sinorhizobium meliloti]|uniref:hypothetical protein n=1 Tax=Rhizobium meliloti TaxID=382 RepID=UPI000FD9AEEB|nr:hypothetical protein [Sinorhizobium meliloti]RVO61810.1 hypothetical protein CN092_01885 [Sinorhizobium meliloti]